MMKIIQRNELAVLNPFLRQLVAQENARGDCMKLEALQQDLIQGHQHLLAFAKNERYPLLFLLCQPGEDRLRGTKTLWVHNFLLVDAKEFKSHDWTAEAKEFDALTARYEKVAFQTDNPALLGFLAEFGYYARATAIVCELTREQGENTLNAAGAAATLEV